MAPASPDANAHLGFRIDEGWPDEGMVHRPALLDGLNEDPDRAVRMAQLLGTTQTTDWAGAVAVIATCRRLFWERVLRGLPDVNSPLVERIDVEPFSDAELDSGLHPFGVQRHDLHPDRLELARRPRLFSVMARDPDRFLVNANSTVGDLLLEDWMDQARGRILSDSYERSLTRHRDAPVPPPN